MVRVKTPASSLPKPEFLNLVGRSIKKYAGVRTRVFFCLDAERPSLRAFDRLASSALPHPLLVARTT
jgi:hypothetical protein